jgi:hypothetical protein
MVHALENNHDESQQTQDEQLRIEVMQRSAVIYLSITAGVSLLFFLVANLIGGYSTVARVGGTLWVGLLSLIIAMPLITARVKKNLKKL